MMAFEKKDMRGENHQDGYCTEDIEIDISLHLMHRPVTCQLLTWMTNGGVRL